MNRRQFLALTSVTAPLVNAGCLSEGRSPETDQQNKSSSANESSTPTLESQVDSSFIDVFEDIHRVDLAAEPRVEDPYSILLQFQSGREAERSFVVYGPSDGLRDRLREFIADTNFEEESLFYIQTTAPNGCLSWLIESFELTAENTLQGSVSVQDENETCGTAIAYPSLLLRVAGDSGPPLQATMTISNGWGETDTVESILFNEYLLRGSTTDNIPPEEGDKVYIPGIVYNEYQEAEMFSIDIVSADGESVFDTSLQVSADGSTNFKKFGFEAEVGTNYEATISVDDIAQSSEFTAKGGQFFEIHLIDGTDLSIELLP